MTRRLLFPSHFYCLLLLLVTLGACSPAVTKPSAFAELKPGNYNNFAEEYRIGAGDELEIQFFFVPDLDDVVQVRPDGRISLMFVRDVMAAGKTPQELTEFLQHKLKRHVKQPDLVVTVKSFASQKVYVGGEVNKPGAVMLTAKASILQVLGEAGWVTPAANSEEIIIIRRDSAKEAVYHINMAQIISGEDVIQDISVQAGDVILVPPSGAIAVDRWVDRNIKNALPFNLGASYIYTNNHANGIIK